MPWYALLFFYVINVIVIVLKKNSRSEGRVFAAVFRLLAKRKERSEGALPHWAKARNISLFGK